jgi:hypothetical protein
VARTKKKEGRFTDAGKLRAVVIERARDKWRMAAGRDLTEEDRSAFADDPAPSPGELNARNLARDLSNALGGAFDFVRQNRALVARLVAEPDRLRNELGPARPLLNFIGLHLRFLVEGPFDREGRPTVLALLNGTASGWRGDTRRRVVALLDAIDDRPTDNPLFKPWEGFGLKQRAGYDTMVCASLLLGEYPSSLVLSKGVTVAQVFSQERAAIRAARSYLRKQIEKQRKVDEENQRRKQAPPQARR